MWHVDGRQPHQMLREWRRAGQGDGKDKGRCTEGFKGQLGSEQRDPSGLAMVRPSGLGMVRGALPSKGGGGKVQVAGRGLSRLVGLECRPRRGRVGTEARTRARTRKVLNARLKLNLQPGQLGTSFLPCIQHSAFSRPADSSTPASARPPPMLQYHVWGRHLSSY